MFFFFQAEDGIRDWSVTGVQTCALPISSGVAELPMPEDGADPLWLLGEAAHVSDRRPLQLLLAARRRPAGDRLLEVGVHALVRVQFRAVRGQVGHLDLG